MTQNYKYKAQETKISYKLGPPKSETEDTGFTIPPHRTDVPTMPSVNAVCSYTKLDIYPSFYSFHKPSLIPKVC